MGQIIHRLAVAEGHEVVGKINSQNKESLSSFDTTNTDVAIEFTNPDTALDNIKFCFSKGIPVVTGTTGWYESLPELEALATKNKNYSLFYASNFSIGVNLFMRMNRFLAKMMNNYEEYDISMQEVHHTQKLDAPSGTAITLAEGILSEVARKESWSLKDENPTSTSLPIEAVRTPNVPGTHTITYTSSIDEITIEHKAYNREGFAKGALTVASWLKNKNGIYTMKHFFDSYK